MNTDPICRYCRDVGADLFKPCRCTDLVHRDCLKLWLETRKQDRPRCEVCLTYYRIKIVRPWLAKLLSCVGRLPDILEINAGFFYLYAGIISIFYASSFYWQYQSSLKLIDLLMIIYVICSILYYNLGYWLSRLFRSNSLRLVGILVAINVFAVPILFIYFIKYKQTWLWNILCNICKKLWIIGKKTMEFCYTFCFGNLEIFDYEESI